MNRAAVRRNPAPNVYRCHLTGRPKPRPATLVPSQVKPGSLLLPNKERQP